MKKTLSVIVALFMVLACFAGFAASAEPTLTASREPANLTTDVGIMLANDVSFEGVVGIQTTGEINLAWRDAVLFELDEETGAYKAIQVVASSGDTTTLTIGENQFVVESNAGNNWPDLYSKANGSEWYYGGKNFQGVPYEECPNFNNVKNQTWDGILKTIAVGDLYTLVGIDLSDPVIDANYDVDANYDYITHNDTYETYSYITPYVVEVDYGIAVGKTYTTVGVYSDADGNFPYPDTDSKEMTDGILPASCAYGDAAWTGFNANSAEYKDKGYAEIVIDLGEVIEISKINVVVNNAQNSGIGAPSAFTYFYSANGTDFTEIGAGAYDVDPFLKDGETLVNANKIVNNSVSAAVSARYVKIQFLLGEGTAWMFIGEAQVFAPAGEEPSDESTPASSADTSKDESSKGDTPVTGDTGIIALAVVSVIALAGAIVIKKR